MTSFPANEPLRGAGDLHLAVIVDPALPPGLLANTVAVIAAGLGARFSGLGGVPLADAAGLSFWNSADRPVPILQAGEAAMRALMEKACGDGEVTAVVFPAFAHSTAFPTMPRACP